MNAGSFRNWQGCARRGIAVMACLGVVAAWAAGPGSVPTAGGASGGIELREGQGGIAGISWTVWRIAGDGAVTVARFLNERELAAPESGRMSAGPLADLYAMFRAAEFDALPGKLGSAPPVNPRSLKLSCAGKTVELVFPAAGPATGEAEASAVEQERTVIRLADEVRKAAQSAVANRDPR